MKNKIQSSAPRTLTFAFAVFLFAFGFSGKAAMFTGNYYFNLNSLSIQEPSPENVTFSPITWDEGLAGSVNAGVLEVNDWSAGKYLSFTVTAAPGYVITPSKLYLYVDRSATDGPSSLDIQNIQNGVALDSTAGMQWMPLAASSPTAASQVLVRFQANGANVSGNDWIRFEQISFEGDLTAVPEPVNVALAGFGALAVFTAAGRRFWAKRNRA